MKCDIYEGNSMLGSSFAAAFALGIFVSYLPQQFTILKNRTTEGINPYFLMLMSLGSSFAFSNILVLSKPVIKCCKLQLGGFDCASSLLGALQLFAGLIGPLILVSLSVKFREEGANGTRMVCSALIVGLNLLVSFSLVLLVKSQTLNRQLATVFGLLALGVGLVQYFPQLYTTYKLKHTGSLSIHMMLIQIPGGFLFALSLMLRKDSHWSTWISILAAASFQLTLLVMSLYYNTRRTVAVGESLVSEESTGYGST